MKMMLRTILVRMMMVMVSRVRRSKPPGWFRYKMIIKIMAMVMMIS